MPFVFAVTFLVLFALLAVLLMRRERKKREARRQDLAALGFRPAENAGILERIIDLAQIPELEQRFHMSELLERVEGETKFYLFDIRAETDGRGSASLMENGIAVVCPSLNLPRLMLHYKVVDGGKLAAWVNSGIEQISKSRPGRIHFPDFPHFEERYMLFAEDEEDVRRLFLKKILPRLSETKYWSLQAGGDCFTVARFDLDEMRGKKDQRTAVAEKLDFARELLWLFVNERRG